MAYTFNQVFGTIGTKNMVTLARAATVGDLPATADENTVVIVSATAVTDWLISAVPPVTPVEGMVWIRENFFSATTITLVGTEKVKLHLAGGSQYISGAWTSVPVYVYINATWHLSAIDVIVDGVLLYGSLNACAAVANAGVSGISDVTGAKRITSVSSSNAVNGLVGISELIDCTGLSSMVVDAVALNSSSNNRNMRYGTDVSLPPVGTNWSASATVGGNFTWTTTRKVVTADISSLTGKHYFAFPSCAASSGVLDVFNVYFC